MEMITRHEELRAMGQPRTIALGPRSSPLCALLFAPCVLHVSPDPPSRREENDDANHKIEPMKYRLQPGVFVPLFAKLLTDICEAETPWQRTGEGVDNKLLQVHARDARRKSNEGANCRQEPANKDDRFAKSIEPTISKIQVVL